jgi:hypothetical protein
MIYITGVFGKAYVPMGKALVKSFSHYMPNDRLLVFSNHTRCFEGAEHCTMQGLIRHRAKYRRHQAANVFKFYLMQDVIERHGDDVCWIDADSLVLDDLSPMLAPGKLNCIRHGYRRPTENFGNGLYVSYRDYALTGFFSAPPGPFLNQAIDIYRTHETWQEQPTPRVRSTGDQWMWNHVVAANPVNVNWVAPPGKLLNMFARHFDERCSSLHVRGDELWNNHRRVSLFYFTTIRLRKLLKEDFPTFSDGVREFVRRWY